MISSPNYGRYYGNSRKCTYNVNLRNAVAVVVEFIDISMHAYPTTVSFHIHVPLVAPRCIELLTPARCMPV